MKNSCTQSKIFCKKLKPFFLNDVMKSMII